jgi:hypothetical protein
MHIQKLFQSDTKKLAELLVQHTVLLLPHSVSYVKFIHGGLLEFLCPYSVRIARNYFYYSY